MNLALFDLDNTLLAGDSDHEWPLFLAEKGLIDGEAYSSQNQKFYQDYQAGTLDLYAFLDFQLQPLTRFSPDELKKLHAEYLETHIRPIVLPKGQALLQKHLAQNDLVVIVTATNRFITAPIAQMLGVDHLIAIELETDQQGYYTGKTLGVPSFKEGKITRTESWLAEQGKSLTDFEQVYFYSDSQNDLPLLSHVNHPVAVDPDPILRQHAEKAGWPIISLRA